jgi:peptide/nickel transport system substrate-binding protein
MEDASSYWRSARRLTRRRLLATMAMTAGGVALTSACGGHKQASTSATAAAGSGDTPQAGGILSYYLVSNPPTLDPQRTVGSATQQVAGAIYNRLFRFRTAHDPSIVEARDLENDLALSAESPDALTWTVKLRPNVKFHNVAPVNGHAFEAEDVKASFTRALDPKDPSSGSLDMLDPGRIETPAADTVVFKLKYPYAAFPSILAVPLYSWILPREALAATYDPAKQMIGTGPFVFGNYTPDVELSFKRNANWFEQGRPYLDGLHLAIIPDPAQRLAQFKGGNLDQITLASTDVDAMKSANPKADLVASSPSQMWPLVGSLADPSSPWNDIRVRRAFSMALDREAIGASVLGGKYQQQAVLPLSLGKWAVKPQELDATLGQVYKYDPVMAKRLLAEAGAANLSIKFMFAPNGYEQPYRTLGETISSMLNAVGIKASVVTADINSEWLASGKGIRYGNFSKDTVIMGGYAGTYTVIDEVLFGFYDSKSNKLFTKLADTTIDGMIDKARATLDADARLKIYQDLQRYMVDKSYYVTGIPWQPEFKMIQPWIRNYAYATDYGAPTEAYAKLWLRKT